jgi:hypothetical protein
MQAICSSPKLLARQDRQDKMPNFRSIVQIFLYGEANKNYNTIVGLFSVYNVYSFHCYLVSYHVKFVAYNLKFSHQRRTLLTVET